jgi:hypothetical protein
VSYNYAATFGTTVRSGRFASLVAGLGRVAGKLSRLFGRGRCFSGVGDSGEIDLMVRPVGNIDHLIDRLID